MILCMEGMKNLFKKAILVTLTSGALFNFMSSYQESQFQEKINDLSSKADSLILDNSFKKIEIEALEKSLDYYKSRSDSFENGRAENKLLAVKSKMLEAKNKLTQEKLDVCKQNKSIIEFKLENKRDLIGRYESFFDKGTNISGTLNNPEYYIKNPAGKNSTIFSYLDNSEKRVSKGMGLFRSRVDTFSALVDSVLSEGKDESFNKKVVDYYRGLLEDFLVGKEEANFHDDLIWPINGFNKEDFPEIDPVNYSKKLFERITGESWPQDLEINFSDNLKYYIGGNYSLKHGITVNSGLDTINQVSSILHEAGHAITHYPSYFESSRVWSNTAKRESLAYLFEMAAPYYAKSDSLSNNLEKQLIKNFSGKLEKQNVSQLDSLSPHSYGVIASNVILGQIGNFEGAFRYMINTDIDEWEKDFEEISIDKADKYSEYKDFSGAKFQEWVNLSRRTGRLSSSLEEHFEKTGYSLKD